MCDFLSVISWKRTGSNAINVFYSTSTLRGSLSSSTSSISVDSHASLADIVGVDEDICFKFEVNPFSRTIEIDTIPDCAVSRLTGEININVMNAHKKAVENVMKDVDYGRKLYCGVQWYREPSYSPNRSMNLNIFIFGESPKEYIRRSIREVFEQSPSYVSFDIPFNTAFRNSFTTRYGYYGANQCLEMIKYINEYVDNNFTLSYRVRSVAINSGIDWICKTNINDNVAAAYISGIIMADDVFNGLVQLQCVYGIYPVVCIKDNSYRNYDINFLYFDNDELEPVHPVIINRDNYETVIDTIIYRGGK